jgi:hypothetical protein
MKPYVLPTILAAFLVIAPGATLARDTKPNPGGASASQMSSQGVANSNGPVRLIAIRG